MSTATRRHRQHARNGAPAKTLLTDHGPVQIAEPRDRNGTFEPRIVKKNQRRLAGLDEKIIALYAGGMTTREIDTYIADLYGPGVGRDTVSRVNHALSEGLLQLTGNLTTQDRPQWHLD